MVELGRNIIDFMSIESGFTNSVIHLLLKKISKMLQTIHEDDDEIKFDDVNSMSQPLLFHRSPPHQSVSWWSSCCQTYGGIFDAWCM